MTATCSLSKDIFFFFDLTINLFTHEKNKKRFHFLNLKKTYNFPFILSFKTTQIYGKNYLYQIYIRTKRKKKINNQVSIHTYIHIRKEKQENKMSEGKPMSARERALAAFVTNNNHIILCFIFLYSLESKGKRREKEAGRCCQASSC